MPPPGFGVPPPPLSPVAQHRVEPLAGRAKVAIIGISVSIAASVVGIAASLARRQELVRLRDGEFVSESRLAQLDDWVQGSGVLAILGVITGAACFLPWFHRAYKNLAAMHKTKHKVGWAIGSWFVPFLNLFRPYQIAKEIAGLSGRTPMSQTNSLPLWWALLIVSGIGNRFLITMDTDSIDDYIRFDTFGAILELVWIASGACLIVFIRRVVRAQETWLPGAWHSG